MDSIINGGIPALKDVFHGKFLIGAAINNDQVTGSNAAETALILKHFNSVTPENCMKWDTIHTRLDCYDFSQADRFVDFGEKNGMMIIGHILVDQAQVPDWVFRGNDARKVGRATLLKRMEEHIETVVGRYKGRIYSWQVVNEAIGPDGRIIKTRWCDIIGDDYILKAFEFAGRADPDVELYYNGHDMLTREATDSIVRLVNGIKERGCRIDGIGIQAHWNLTAPAIEEVEAGFINLREAGVKVMITELDITILPRGISTGLNPYPSELPSDLQEQLAERYGSLFRLFDKYKDMIGRINFWGVHDGQSWLNYWPVAGRTDYPLLFDRQLQPKPAFFSVIETAGLK